MNGATTALPLLTWARRIPRLPGAAPRRSQGGYLYAVAGDARDGTKAQDETGADLLRVSGRFASESRSRVSSRRQSHLSPDPPGGGLVMK